MVFSIFSALNIRLATQNVGRDNLQERKAKAFLCRRICVLIFCSFQIVSFDVERHSARKWEITMFCVLLFRKSLFTTISCNYESIIFNSQSTIYSLKFIMIVIITKTKSLICFQLTHESNFVISDIYSFLLISGVDLSVMKIVLRRSNFSCLF